MSAETHLKSIYVSREIYVDKIAAVRFILSDGKPQVKFGGRSHSSKTDYGFKFDVNPKVCKVSAESAEYNHASRCSISEGNMSKLQFHDSDGKICFDTSMNEDSKNDHGKRITHEIQ